MAVPFSHLTRFNLEPSYLDFSLSRILIKGEQREAERMALAALKPHSDFRS